MHDDAPESEQPQPRSPARRWVPYAGLAIVAVLAAVAGQARRERKAAHGARGLSVREAGAASSLAVQLDAKLVPIVRPRVDFEIARIEASTDPLAALPPPSPHVALTDALWGAVAYETKGRLEPLSAEQLQTLAAAPIETIWPALVARYAQRAADVPVLAPNGVYEIAAADGNAGARLVVPSTFTSLPLRGGAVVAVPSDERLLVADGADEKSVAALADRLKDIWDDAPCQLRLFRVENGVVAPLAAASIPGLADMVAHEESAAAQDDAKRQKAALEKKLDAEDADTAPFVATFMRTRDPKTEREASFVVQTDDEATLLTPAEWVVFRRVDLEKKTATTLGCAPWREARTVMGARWTETPLWPVRVRTKGFPTADELTRMGCAFAPFEGVVGVALPLGP